MYYSKREEKSKKLSDTKSELPTFVVDGREFQAYRLFFQSRQQAADAGYRPRSHWTKLGRDVVEVPIPAAVVIRSWRTFHPAKDELVLGWSLFSEYLVSTTKFLADRKSRACWFVYCENQTEPTTSANKDKVKTELAVQEKSEKRGKKKKEKKSSETTSPSSLTTSSYDGENHVISDTKSNADNNLQQNHLRTRLITKPSKGRNVEVYFPQGFDWAEYPALAPYQSSVLWFFHKLHERRFVNTEGSIHDKDAFISIKTEYARQIDPKFRHVVKQLLDLGIVERDYYEQGAKSYGYRLVDPSLRHAKRTRVPLNDKKLAKRIDAHRKKEISTRADRWLHSQLFQLALTEVDETFLTKVAAKSYRENGGSIEDKLEAYHYVLERISKQEHSLASDSQGRRYSLVTNLKRELRSVLRVDGQRLMQIDLRNSQWLFLALEMRRAGIDCPDYFQACERGILYETVAKKAKSDRPKVKKALTQRALFSDNDAACQRSKIKKTFDKLFPEVDHYLRGAKKHGDGSRLAKTLQAAEAELIIGNVCGRLRREGKVEFVTPVHDSLLFLPEDGEYIKAVMTEEFAKLGLEPRLEIKEV